MSKMSLRSGRDEDTNDVLLHQGRIKLFGAPRQ